MIGRVVARFPRSVLAASVAVFVIFVAVAAGAMDSLSLSRFETPDSESVEARELMADRFGTGSPNVAVLVSVGEGAVDDDPAASVGRALTDDLSDYPGVGDAWSYWSPNAPRTLASEDGRHALVAAWVPGDADHVRDEVLPGIEADLIEPIDESGVEVQLGGSDEVFRTVGEQAASDFLRAELIIIPLVTLLLWVVYRRFRLALLTIGVGLFSVAGTLAILRLLTNVVEISTFGANLALVMGVALGVDYSLFVSYRFREELAAGHPVPDAVRRAVAGAGRTVVFSGLTVAASLSVLLAFSFPFLASFAYVGVAVVTTETIGAVVVLPAALRLLGARATRRGREPSQQRWFRLASLVMRRPVVTGGAGLIVLVALGSPALGVNFGAPDDRVLPPDQPVVGMYDTIRDEFTTEDVDALNVLAEDTGAQQVEAHAAALSLLDGVLRVDSAAGSYTDGIRTGEAVPGGPERFIDGTATWLSVVPTGERLAEDPTGLRATSARSRRRSRPSSADTLPSSPTTGTASWTGSRWSPG